MINSTFQEIARQLILLNQKHVEITTKINQILTSSEETITIIDENNVPRTSYSVGFLKKEIDSIKQSLRSLMGVGGNGRALLSQNGKSSLLIKHDLEQEGEPIDTIDFKNNFVFSKNFDLINKFLDPYLFYEIDLSGKVRPNIEKVIVRKFSLRFTTDASGNLTPNGQISRDSFLSNFSGRNDITYSDWTTWFRQNRAGIVSETVFSDLELNVPPQHPKFSGTFDVIRIENISGKTFYVLDTLQYISNNDSSSTIYSLNIGDVLALNDNERNSTFKIVDVIRNESLPKVVLERQEGIDIIPVTKAALKLVSPIDLKQIVKIPISFDEYCVIFVKPINPFTNVGARRWSFGVAFWTNDLVLSSNDQDNGIDLASFYQDRIFDFGVLLRDFIGRFQPTRIGIKPNPPVLNPENFKVIIYNSHILNSPSTNNIRSLIKRQTELKSQIDTLNQSIRSLQKNSSSINNNELRENQKKLKSSLMVLEKLKNEYKSIVESLSKNSNEAVNISPIYRVIGFWAMPLPKVSAEFGVQEVIQFEIQYKILNSSGNERETTTIRMTNSDGSSTNAAFSEWRTIMSKVRERGFNRNLNRWIWLTESLSDVEQPNLNSLELPIHPGEQLQIRIRSISEVGWPDSLIKSDWSNIITISFPNELLNTSLEIENAKKIAEIEESNIRIDDILISKGLIEHINDSISSNNRLYVHSLENISSGIFDNNNNRLLSALEIINQLRSELNGLREQINNMRGVLKIFLSDINNNEISINNDQEINLNAVISDFINQGIVINEVSSLLVFKVNLFTLKIQNASTTSNLSFFSNLIYNENSPFYPVPSNNSTIPRDVRQATWVDLTDKILVGNDRKTQASHQWIWLDANKSDYSNDVSSVNANLGNAIMSRTSFEVGTIGTFKDKGFAASIHPMIKDFSVITADNSIKKFFLTPGATVEIPIILYFSLGRNIVNLNSDFINRLMKERSKTLVRKLSFHMDLENYTQPFKFTLTFNISNHKNNLSTNKSSFSRIKILPKR